jgi:hypothetical protein
MRRNHYCVLTGEYKDHQIDVRYDSEGRPTFTTDALMHFKEVSWTKEKWETKKEFDSLESILNAIDRYETSQRKDFVNSVAYRVQGWDNDTLGEVTVTSITEDGREAWITFISKSLGGEKKREKVGITSLYNSHKAVEAFIRGKADAKVVYERTVGILEAELNKHRWKPEAK